MTAKIPLEKDAARLVRIYRNIRAAKEELTAKYDAEAAKLEEQMTQCSIMLQNLLDENNTLSMKTADGTVTKTVKNRYWNVDWPAFHAFVKANDLPDLYEKRIAQRNMAEFLEQNPGVAVPGLQVDRRFDVLVRKPTNKE